MGIDRKIASLRRGRYAARLGDGAGDLAAALALRARCFRAGAQDGDGFDEACAHMLVEERGTGRLVCTFRLLPLASGEEISKSYSAQHYDLGALAAYPLPMLEMGRFCVEAKGSDADILRVAWGAMTRLVDASGVGMLFGCASFPGTDAYRHRAAFGLLRSRHMAPAAWRPALKSSHAVRFPPEPVDQDPRRAALALPPLLRSYLAMGGWVSDHAVRDPDLGTLHVFTGLEIAGIPPARARALRLVAG